MSAGSRDGGLGLGALRQTFALKAVSALAEGDDIRAVEFARLCGDPGELRRALTRAEVPIERAQGLLLECTGTTSGLAEARLGIDSDLPRDDLNSPYFSTTDWKVAAATALRWVEAHGAGGTFRIRQSFVPTYALAAIAAHIRPGGSNPARIELDYLAPAAQFAVALGLQSIGERSHRPWHAKENSRTVPLFRVENLGQVLDLSQRMAGLLLSGEMERNVRDVVTYSLVELMRNVVQHSHDSLGGIAVAQLIQAEHGPQGSEAVQIAIADCGLGIEATLAELHPDVKGRPIAAIQKAMRPHISGKFPEGDRPGVENAGLGLFFLSRIAKRLHGRILVASRGGAIYFGELDDAGHLRPEELIGCSFPGTLVVLELPKERAVETGAYSNIIDKIREEELPQYALPNLGGPCWIVFSEPLDAAAPRRVLISSMSKSFASMRELVESAVLPAIRRGTPVVLDFLNVRFLTDSMAHELVVQAVPEAYERRVKIYAVNADSAIANTLVFVQRYVMSTVGSPNSGKRKWRGPRARYLKPPGV